MNTPAISVVITAHNEAAHIRRTLHEIAAQTGAFEVILVDDRSTDATRAEALAAGLVDFRLLRASPDPASPLTTRQQALDLGFRAARGRVIVTLDADSRLQPGWLSTLTAPILEGSADAVAGPVTFAGPGWLAHWQSVDAAWYHLMCALVARAGLGGGAMFGNFAFRAALYRDLGGYTALGPALTEDLALARALGKAGYRLHYTGAKTRVTVRACPDFAALVRRSLRITRAPLSPLAVVLTLWPLSLLLAALWAAILPGGAGVLAARYIAGVTLSAVAVWKNGTRRNLVFAPFYELLVFVLGAAAALAWLRGYKVEWGGRVYD